MPTNENAFGPGRLGRLPARSDTRALLFSAFATPPRVIPSSTHFWRRRAAFPLRTFGNDKYGDCTIAKQAAASMRFERLEVKRTPEIDDDAVVRTYFALSDRLYGGGDNGAYETDALNNWRNPETTFKDTQGRPLTIDAYTRLNPADHDEIRTAILMTAGHGIAICLNLPLGFRSIRPPDVWDVPDGCTFTGQWLPGSWGGHSMWTFEYEVRGIWLDSTWGQPPQLLSWRAAAAYLDEAHLVIDSLDAWRKAKAAAVKGLDLAGIKKAVNAVSRVKVA